MKKGCKNEGLKIGFLWLVILYQCLSNYTYIKAVMILHYYTRNRICRGFSIHMYHIICHWSSYSEIIQIENDGVVKLAPIRNQVWKNYSVKYCNILLQLVQIFIEYKEYISDYCDHISSTYIPALQRYRYGPFNIVDEMLSICFPGSVVGWWGFFLA